MTERLCRECRAVPAELLVDVGSMFGYERELCEKCYEEHYYPRAILRRLNYREREEYEGERIRDYLTEEEVESLARSLHFPTYYGGYWSPTEVRALSYPLWEDSPRDQSNLETALDRLQRVDDRVTDAYIGGALGRIRELVVPLTDLEQESEKWALWFGEWEKFYRPESEEVGALPIGKALRELVEIHRDLEQYPVLNEEHYSELEHEQEWEHLEGEVGHFCRLWEEEHEGESEEWDPWDYVETDILWSALVSLGAYRTEDVSSSDLERAVLDRITELYHETTSTAYHYEQETGRELPTLPLSDSGSI